MILNKKFTNVAQCITFMAIMAAINVIFVLLTTFVPFLLFLLVFLLPLCCTLVVLMCSKRYFLIYAFATVGLCLIVTLNNISDTLFYIIPSMITGFVFAVCVEKGVPYSIGIITATFIQFGLSYALIPLIELITHVHILHALEELFHITNLEYLQIVEFLAVFIVCFMQEILSFIVIKYGLKKLNYEIKEDEKQILYIEIGSIINLLLATIFTMLHWSIAAVFLFSSFYFAFFEVVWIIFRKNKINYIIAIVLTTATVFGFAAAYSGLGNIFGIYVLIIYLCALLIIVFINNCLAKRN